MHKALEFCLSDECHAHAQFIYLNALNKLKGFRENFLEELERLHN